MSNAAEPKKATGLKGKVRKRVFRAAKQARERTGLPPRYFWGSALPGTAAVYERRWDRLIARTPVITAEEHCRRVGMQDIEQVVHCSLCGDDRVQPLFEPRNVNKGWHYHVVRCANCSFLYRLPGIKPERLGDLYSGRYDKFLTGHYGRSRQRRYRLVMDSFSPVFDDGHGRRLFDFGCGAGSFLKIAHEERGFETYGVDLSEASIEHARQFPYGQNAYYGSPMEVPEIAAGGFDVVTMWSVLAHLPKPVEDLTMLRGLLNDDGVLLILTVNANAIFLKNNRDRWDGFTENHLKFFSPQTLPLLLKKAGFGAVTYTSMYGDAVEAGTTRLNDRQVARLKNVVDRGGNQGQMMRALAFADASGVPETLRERMVVL